MSTIDTRDHYWEFTVAAGTQKAVCQSCGKTLTVAYVSETVAERTVRLVQFMKRIDKHELSCWGYVDNPLFDYPMPRRRSYTVTPPQPRQKHRAMLTANLLLILGVIAILVATNTVAFLRPDPLVVVATTLEAFAANQTAILAAHLETATQYLAGHTRVLARLTEYLDSETTRGKRLRRCLTDPASC